MMTSVTKDLVSLIVQFLEEENFTDSAHKLKQESGLYFNLCLFEELVMNGDWENVEKYLLGFTTIEDNFHSAHMFFEIRKQKYLEALHRNDTTKALDILAKDFKPFSHGKFFGQLLTLENFREDEQLSNNMDPKTSRRKMLNRVKVMIEYNTKLREKNFPASRLRTLITQSLNWQHQLCKTPQPKPCIKTLFSDHTCDSSQQNGGRVPSAFITASVARPVRFAPTGPYRQPATGGLQPSMAGWMLNPSQLPHPLNPQQYYSIPGSNMAMDNHNADSAPLRKRPRHSPRLPDEVNIVRMNALHVASTSQTHGHNSNHQHSANHDLPNIVIMNINQGSEVKSADFHPIVERALLLVGTKSGEVKVWELSSQNIIFRQSFSVWNIEDCSRVLKESLKSDYSASINRVMWSPYGSICGVAYSKNIVHLYNDHHHGQDLENYLEIEAHSGSVNDLAFSYPNEKHCLITCGQDMLIKLWDVVSGEIQYTFESHKASVHSVCLHRNEEIHFIVSTATDGKIKAWLYYADGEGDGVEFIAPGHTISTMSYSADGERFFSCGTGNDGEAYLLEWNISDGVIKRRYTGFGKAAGIIQFDTMKNRILAAGDEFKIKFWDMDDVNLLEETDANGGLPQSPYIRFNKDGTLLAVSTNENSLKILGSTDGVRLLRTIGKRPYENVKSPSVSALDAAAMGSNTFDRVAPSAAVNGEHRSFSNTNSKTRDGTAKKSRIINEPSHCLSLRLPYCSTESEVSRLTYNSSGTSILALSTNAVNNLWKWDMNEHNPTGKATANTVPILWNPSDRRASMTNDISNGNLKDAFPCFALSKNDSYLFSASGGKIFLFNMNTFETMLSFMPSPSAATCLALDPRDNNTVVIGKEDFSIQIYNVRSDEHNKVLKGHKKRITGLAFSKILGVLVSSGSDSQLCVWSIDTWETLLSKDINLPAIGIQFHQDQNQLLIVHETEIAIFEALSLNCLKQWKTSQSSGRITYATYSCDSENIYVSHVNGIVVVLTASSLRVSCRIYPSAYIPANLCARIYPVVIAAHPEKASQIALGLSDGGVYVLEPLGPDGIWGTVLQDHAL